MWGSAAMTRQDSLGPPGSDRRTSPRVAVRRAVFAVTGATAAKCRVLDIARDGARIEMRGAAPWSDPFVLVDPKSGLAHETRLVWRSETEAGLRFVRTTSFDGPVGGAQGAVRKAAELLRSPAAAEG
ncbi:MAG: type pilus assembly PilZ [Caulobacter sp.]|nr:type pilus assembly PilZ [Caulobacter sp.]